MILLKFKRKTAGKANFKKAWQKKKKKAWQMSKGGGQKKKKKKAMSLELGMKV